MNDTKKRAACGHPEYRDGHCAAMGCRNYVSKCDVHMIAAVADAKACSLGRNRK